MPCLPKWKEAKHHRLLQGLPCGMRTAQRREPGLWLRFLAWRRTMGCFPFHPSEICTTHGSRDGSVECFGRAACLSERIPFGPQRNALPPFSWNTAKQVFLACVYPPSVYHVYHGLGRMLGRAACLICFGHFPRRRDALAPIASTLPLGTAWGRAGMTRPALCRQAGKKR